MVLCLAACLAACKKPPPAPEGLDASSSYLIRNFYADDPTFQAGVQGFMGWYEEEGYLLVGSAATTSNTDSFVVTALTPEDVGYLPLTDPLLDGDGEEYGARDLTRAPGVVSLADMECAWTEAEAWLARADQDIVFPDDFEGYDRTFLGDRDTFQQASVDGEYDEVEEALDPFGAGFDDAAMARTLLRTMNDVDPKAVLTADLDAYPMHLDFRHGVYEVNDEEISAAAIITWTDAAAWGSGGDNALLQQYSVEINVQLPENHTLRMLAVWSEPHGSGIEPGSTTALNYAVNKSLKSSERMSDLCSGAETVDPE
jgi:hypothetical protein